MMLMMPMTEENVKAAEEDGKKEKKKNSYIDAEIKRFDD